MSPWIKLDASFDEHPKVEQIGEKAAYLFIRCLLYCKRVDTDGFVPGSIVRRFAPGKTGRDAVETLVDTRLLTVESTGFCVSKYLEYQEVNAGTRDRRAKNAERQARHRAKSNALRNAPSNALRNAPREEKRREEKKTTLVDSTIDVSYRFDEFWSVVPKRESKAKSTEWWERERKAKRLDDPLIDTIIAYFKWDTTRCQTEGRDKEHIPHPIPVLNQRRWEDEEWITPATPLYPPGHDAHGRIPPYLDDPTRMAH